MPKTRKGPQGSGAPKENGGERRNLSHQESNPQDLLSLLSFPVCFLTSILCFFFTQVWHMLVLGFVLEHGFLSWYNKTVMPKKKVIAAIPVVSQLVFSPPQRALSLFLIFHIS